MYRTFRPFFTTSVCAIVSIFIFSPLSTANDIKERIKSRLPMINDLKSRGIVGENNQGYLEFKSPNREQENVVNAENNDRRQVYTIIGRQQGTSADVVGQRRALKIAKKANFGVWLQDVSGNWYQNN